MLGRRVGYRIGEAPDRDGQYFHYLAMWIYALSVMGRHNPKFHERAVNLARAIHPYFARPGIGVIWKMREDLSGPYAGYGLGALDAFHGYVVYKLLNPKGLAAEIEIFRGLVDQSAQRRDIDQDLGLGMMLWITHFFPEEEWAKVQRRRSEKALDGVWFGERGYFYRQRGAMDVKFAVTNYGISLGLQSCELWPERVHKLNDYFEGYRSYDEYDPNAITHAMACTSHFPGLFLRATLQQTLGGAETGRA